MTKTEFMNAIGEEAAKSGLPYEIIRDAFRDVMYRLTVGGYIRLEEDKK